ncbi:hypothetical protein [Geminocystis sp. NIES-3709]|uniref:hypothetical protein n=1 Tax=Geminocystis sp. NIES-3709 TaxID=1617448 RepID=UPI0005FC9A1A|nr:hypothetical protein [Geminocystis sp. NIES-3709]BAQ63462.1 hypothetical protein GM3709_227 [Geminocystis sp. NIES-3709]
MSHHREQNLDKFQLSLYLMPLFGPIWALINLKFFPYNLNSEQKKTSRISLRLGLAWLITYSTLWAGGSLTSDLLSIRLLYFNGIITTTYFLICLILITRLWSKKN